MNFIPTPEAPNSGGKAKLVIRIMIFCLLALLISGLISFFTEQYQSLVYLAAVFGVLSSSIYFIRRGYLEMVVLLTGIFCYAWLNYLPFIMGHLSGTYLNFMVIFLIVSYAIENEKLKWIHWISSLAAITIYFSLLHNSAFQKVEPPFAMDIISIISGFSLIVIIWFVTQNDISNQNKSLHKTRSFLKTLVDNNPLAIVTKDKNKRITFANQTALEVYQIDEHSLLGKNNEELQNGVLEGSDYKSEIEDKILERGEVVKNVLEFHPHTSKGEKWFKSFKKPLKNEKGEIYGMMIFAEDITSQKKAEEALLESEFRYRNLIENNQFGMATDKNSFLTSVNDALCEMTGYSRNELLGRNVYEIVEVLDPVDKIQQDVQLLHSGKIPFLELSCIYHRKDGSKGYGLVRKSIITNSRGEIVEQLATIADVSILKEKENAFRLSQKKYLSLFESMPLGLLILDTRDSLAPIETNPKWQEMIGCTAEKSSKKTILEVSPPFQPDGKNSYYKFELILEDYHKSSKVLGFEWQFTDTNNINFPAYCILQPIPSEERTLTMMIVRDISEEKRQATTIIQQMKDLNEKNLQLGQFGYVVSHNFRSSVANIMGLQEILKDESQRDSLPLETINMMGQVVERLDEAIKDLNLIFSLQNKSNLDFTPINLKVVLNEAKNLMEKELAKSGATLSFDLNEDIYLMGIKSYFVGIFQNLISNSIKYRQADLNPHISIRASKSKRLIYITFQDNGRGIDMDKFGKDIFSLYKRFHDDVEGKGIGLYLVKIQTEVMKGKVSIHSQIGQGTSFQFCFPEIAKPHGGEGPLSIPQKRMKKGPL